MIKLLTETMWILAGAMMLILYFCLPSCCSFGWSPGIVRITAATTVAASSARTCNKPITAFLIGNHHHYHHHYHHHCGNRHAKLQQQRRHHHHHNCFTRLLAFSTESSSNDDENNKIPFAKYINNPPPPTTTRISNSDEDLNEGKGVGGGQKRREQDLQEIFQAEKRAEGKGVFEGDNNKYNYNSQDQWSYLGGEELPDLNPFKAQVQKNTNGKDNTLSKSLSFPDYNDKSKKTNLDGGDGGSSGAAALESTTTTNQPFASQQQQQQQQASPQMRRQQQLIEDDDDDDDESSYDGFYLSPDIYQRSRDLLHGDGSLDMESFASDDDGNNNAIENPDGRKAILELLLQSELASSSSSSTLSSSNSTIGDDVDDDNWNDIWLQIQTLQSRPYNASRSEELHKQVFDQEEGYLQQSERFRQSLTDPTIASKATYERRSANYLARQTKAIQQLNRNIDEFENTLRNANIKKRPRPTNCDRCNVKLVEKDYDIAPQLWMTKRFNITTICQVCYGDLMETSQNFQKLQPTTTAATTTTTTTTTTTQDQQTKSQLPSKTPRKSGDDASTASATPAVGGEATIKSTNNNRKNKNGSSSSRESRARKEEQQQSTTTNGAATAARSSSSSEPPSSSEERSSWTEVQDPDTGETFYMNDEQNDVRWEI